MVGFTTILAAGACGGQKHSEGGLEFRNWYVVKPIVAGSGSVAYGNIRNKSGLVKTLTAADFACAASTALHETRVIGDRASMSPLSPVEIADGATVDFEPGHKHIMLGPIKAEATESCDVSFTLSGAAIRFKIPVKPREK